MKEIDSSPISSWEGAVLETIKRMWRNSSFSPSTYSRNEAFQIVGQRASTALGVSLAIEKSGEEDFIEALGKISEVIPYHEYLALIHLALLGIERAVQIEAERDFFDGLSLPDFRL